MYTIGLPEHIRFVLRVWGVISVLVIALGLVMAVAALFVGEYQSVLFALWLPAFALVVWWHWRRIGSRAPELEDQFRLIVGSRA